MQRKEIIEKIRYIIRIIYNQDINVYEEFLKIYPYIADIYREFIELVPVLNKIGLELNSENMISELNNISDAIEKKDKVLLYETLLYGTCKTIEQYNEIKDIMEQQ